LKEQLKHHYPSGLFFIKENVPGEIERFLTENLVLSVAQTSRHRLWGNEAQQISDTGKWLGWIPSHQPFLFFADTVSQEIANSFAAPKQKAEGSDKDRQKAVMLLEKMKLTHLAKRNPYTLSQGESKIIWFLVQWAKAPEYLVISDFNAGLSESMQNRLIEFITKKANHTEVKTVVLAGIANTPNDWIKMWTHQGWRHVNGFLGDA